MRSTSLGRRSVVLAALATTTAVTACGGAQGRRRAPAQTPSAGGESMRAEVVRQWGRVTSWLGEHAPATHARLRPPVTAGALARFERIAGGPVHEDLAAWWSLNDGTYLFTLPAFLDGYAPLGVDGSLRCRPQADAEESGWERSWVPFACNDPTDPYSGLFHDARTGFVGHWAEADRPALWRGTTLAGYLKRQADALYRAGGRPAPGQDVPGVWNGHLVWDNPADRLRDELEGWRPVHREHHGDQEEAR
ncbi:hypothetical protein [Streptomyces flaveolus]|uniref:hypothetical protein n=1 Tax=Streptomyces flaveolus TaxID=67297 RepID=UPI00340B07FF